MVGKAKNKSLELPLLNEWNKPKQKQHLISGGFSKMDGTTKCLGNSSVVIFTVKEKRSWKVVKDGKVRFCSVKTMGRKFSIN